MELVLSPLTSCHFDKCQKRIHCVVHSSMSLRSTNKNSMLSEAHFFHFFLNWKISVSVAALLEELGQIPPVLSRNTFLIPPTLTRNYRVREISSRMYVLQFEGSLARFMSSLLHASYAFITSFITQIIR